MHLTRTPPEARPDDQYITNIGGCEIRLYEHHDKGDWSAHAYPGPGRGATAAEAISELCNVFNAWTAKVRAGLELEKVEAGQ